MQRSISSPCKDAAPIVTSRRPRRLAYRHGRGGDVVVVEGEARIDETVPRPEDNAAYNRKYGEWIRDQFTTAEEFTSVYNVPVRIRPTRGRAFGA